MISGNDKVHEAAESDAVTDAPPRRCVLAICEGEWRDFFPGELGRELKSLFSVFEWVKPNEIGAEEWERILCEVDPEILVSGWSTPSLPKDFYDGDLRNLRYMCHLTGQVRSKVRRVDLERGLIVTNWGNAISHTVAEHSLLLAMACLRRISFFATTLHEGRELRKVPVRTLFGRRVGIHGFGQVARDLVRLLQCFDVSIKVHSPETPDALLEEYGVEAESDLLELFSSSEVVFELEGLTERSRGAVTEEHLRALPSDGVFINCGRAGIVDEKALIKVAKDGRIQFGLDVFHQEPLPLESELRGLANVTMTPHVAGPTPEMLGVCGRYALDNIKRWISGQTVLAQVSLAHYDNMT